MRLKRRTFVLPAVQVIHFLLYEELNGNFCFSYTQCVKEKQTPRCKKLHPNMEK